MINLMTRQRIHIHHEAGLTHRRIAELTETSVRFVQRVLDEPMPSPAELTVGRLTPTHGVRPVFAVPCVEQLTALLQERADLPTTEILRIATTECGWSGSKATFFRLVRNLRPVQVPEPMVRCEGLPGEFAQFDFGEAVVIYADERTEKVIIFVGRLKLSRQVQVYVVPDQKTETLVRRVVAWWRAAGSGAGRPWSGCSIIPRPWS